MNRTTDSRDGRDAPFDERWVNRVRNGEMIYDGPACWNIVPAPPPNKGQLIREFRAALTATIIDGEDACEMRGAEWNAKQLGLKWNNELVVAKRAAMRRAAGEAGAEGRADDERPAPPVIPIESK